MGTYRLSVNQRSHPVTVKFEDTPLLYVLRNELGLKGTRFGCGTGQCGTCTVLVDGQAQHSCELPVWAAEGKAITTIEGLGSAGLHPLQQAIIEFQAGQCGYCLTGIIMTVAGLIGAGGDPSRERMAQALTPVLCRCGAHSRILAAFESAWKKIAGNPP